MKSKFHAHITSPQGILFDGDVFALSLYNSLGPFDIIEKHTNFISLIHEKIIIHDLEKRKKEIPITDGIVRVSGTGVEVFVNFTKEEK